MTTHSCFSPQTRTDYRLLVRAPDGVTEPGPWPVVVILDGDDQFKFALAEYEALRGARAIRPLLLVGVGYGASYRDPANRRGRDYTPTRTADEPESGAADAFLAFLTDTLWPELQQRYPVDAHVRGIAGHSVGALFVLHALFQSQPFFTHHLASAPSIWWDNRAILCHAQRLRREQALLRTKLVLGIGDEDSASMRGDLAMLEDQLAAEPFGELQITSFRFPQRTHFDVLPDAYRAGLRALFGE